MGKLFGTDGVRGKANAHPITPEFALQLGKAIARIFRASGHGSKKCVIGKDTRLSGYMLESSLTSGLVSMGMDAHLVGPLPTPAVAHLTRSMAADCGIMITASHNPAVDNGIKIFDRDGFKLSDENEAAIEELILGGEISSSHIAFNQIGKAHRIDDARGRYIEFAKGTVGSLDLRGLRIAIDCANGAAYSVGPLILQELGAEVFSFGANPDGYNINDGCGALHLDRLCNLVWSHKADLGIAFDGDADRVVFVDEHGKHVDGNIVLGLCARELKRRQRLRHNTLVTTVMANLGLHRSLLKEGIKVVTTPVGDRHVIEALRADGYSFGGEDSGHLIFLDHSTTGDGVVSALQVLNAMLENQCSLGRLAAGVQLFPAKLVNHPVREKLPLEDLAPIQQVLQDCDAALGNNGRHLVRYSGTENLLRIMVEAPEQAQVDEWIARIAAAANECLG